MALTRSELESLSLYYYIKEALLAREFGQEVQNLSLTLTATASSGLPSGTPYSIYALTPGTLPAFITSNGRGLLSFDLEETDSCKIYNPATSGFVDTYNTPFKDQSFSFPLLREFQYVTVRDQNDSIMDPSWYQLDYQKARVRFPISTTPSGVVASGLTPSLIDLRYHRVATVKGWPDSASIPPLPFVAIYPVKETPPEPLQIGGGVSVETMYTIDVYGDNQETRDRVLNTIKNGLYNKHAPVIDFNRTGEPLNQNGTINENFIQDIDFQGDTYRGYLTLNQSNGNNLYFLNIEVLYDAAPRASMSESTRHKGQIRVTTCTYTDRDPGLVGKYSGLNEPPGGFDSLTKKSYSA